MTKVSMLLLFNLFFLQQATAQWTLGLKMGLNFATLASLPSGIENKHARIGLMHGIYIRRNISSTLFLQIDPALAEKGGVTEQNLRVTVVNLDLPCILGLQGKKAYLGGGILFGFPINSKVADDDNNTLLSNNSNRPLSAWVIALGFNPRDLIGIDFRYEFGRTRLYNNFRPLGDTKTNVFQFTLNYKLR